MFELKQIQTTVQQVANAIASVLNVEVTIADMALCRIAGTGRYADKVGVDVGQGSAFAHVLNTGKSLVIAQPGKEGYCTICHIKNECLETAEVCTPIKYNGTVIGIVALVAFNEVQRKTLLENQHDLFGFLARMAELLASKAAEQEQLRQINTIKNQLATVVNTVSEGIIAIDKTGKIVQLNVAARNMLGIIGKDPIVIHIDSIISGLHFDDMVNHSKEIIGREVSRTINGRRTRFLVSSKPWFENNLVIGFVVTLREMAEVRKFVSHIAINSIQYTFDMILGKSQSLRSVKETAAKAACSNVTVLIQGESGTGKELFARAIHSAGERQTKPFIAVNCAAIPEALLESELFGYEEGAFTGARRGGKPGKFELADGGTLFLDEIGDMSLGLQAKLLRVLQDKQIERVGGVESIQVDVRIIAATHKDVDAMVRTGEFRGDLYYRINIFPLFVPALRDRRDDIPLLIEYFLDKCATPLGKTGIRIEEDAHRLLYAYHWPGNIRELENTIEYLVNVTPGQVISLAMLPGRLKESSNLSTTATGVIPLKELENQAIRIALGKFGYSLDGKAKAAHALGISRATLYRRLQELDSRPPNEK